MVRGAVVDAVRGAVVDAVRVLIFAVRVDDWRVHVDERRGTWHVVRGALRGRGERRGTWTW